MRNNPKSNKIKKQKLKEKKHKPIPPKKTPIIYVIPQKVRNFTKTIEEIFDGNYTGYGLNHIADIVAKHHNKNFLKDIILRLLDQKIEFTQYQPSYNNPKRPIDFIDNLARYPNAAIRSVKDWKSPTYNTHRALANLARHLYAKYFVPNFMDDVWYTHTTHQEWFIHIGQGQNIRTTSGLPVPLTKREAHFFLQAPRDFAPLHAIRYGQIVNMGGNEVFVRQILKTRIANDFDVEHNRFWYSVFVWLMANPMLDTHHYAPILDFIHNQKYAPYMFIDGKMLARQPNFSMKGRDPETLLRQVEAWHKQLGKEKTSISKWKASGRPEFCRESGGKTHVIQEILTSKKLIDEGRLMAHCAASYAGSCASGRTSIWAYEILSREGTDKRLTIEVDNQDCKVVQARGKYNELPTASDMHFVRMWANIAGLRISRYIT